MKKLYTQVVLTLILIVLALFVWMNRFHFINDEGMNVWRFNKITGKPRLFFPNRDSRRIGFFDETYQSRNRSQEIVAQQQPVVLHTKYNPRTGETFPEAYQTDPKTGEQLNHLR